MSTNPPRPKWAEVARLAEQHVASVALHAYASDRVLELLGPGDFAHHAFRIVVEAVRELRRKNVDVALDAIYSHMLAAGTAKDLGDNPALFLAELYDVAPTAANLTYFADQVRDAAVRRRIIALAGALLNDVEDPIEPAAETGERFARLIAEASADPTARDPVKLSGAFETAMADLNARSDRGIARTRSAFVDLAEVVPGFDAGQLIVIGGRPGSGKTAYAMAEALSTGLSGTPVYFASLEMSRGELAQRSGFAITGVASHKFRSGHASPDELRALERDGRRLLEDAKIWIDDTPGLKVEQIASAARRHKLRNGLGMVVVDYLQLVAATDRRADRREQVEHVSRTLKRLARELEVPVLALSQLNREVESRPDQKPRMADLREAGGLEQDADAVLLLWKRTGQSDDDAVWRIGCQIAKQRNGPTGEVTLAYRRACMRFENYAPEM